MKWLTSLSRGFEASFPSASSNTSRPPGDNVRNPEGAVFARAPRQAGPLRSLRIPPVRRAFRSLGGPGGSNRLWPSSVLPSSSGLQFSLSESVGDTSMVTLSFPLGVSQEFSLSPSTCTMLEFVRPSFGFLAWRDRGCFDRGALRLDPLGCKILLEERSKLMAAIAEPFDSFSASVVNSSRVSASAHSSHAWTSRDRPRARRGGRELVNVEMGGNVMVGSALRLRCKPLWRTCGRTGRHDEGLEGVSRVGEDRSDTSSAFPSSDSDNLI